MARVIDNGNGILDSLRSATGASACFVKDAFSPVVWWHSGPVEDGLIEAILENLIESGKAELGERSLQRGALVRLCRVDSAPLGFCFSFAGIYLLVVAFENSFNRFVTEPHVRRALPLLEQLVPKLPPLDDADRGPGKVRGLRQKPPKK